MPWVIAGLAILVAAAGVGFWLVSRGGDDVGVITGAPEQPQHQAPPAGAAGFAELYVIAYLSGDGDELSRFYPGAPSLESMTAGAHVARHAAAVESVTVDDGYWLVTVAADVLDLTDAGYVAAGLSYFRVGVVDDGGRLVAVSLPSRVAAPPARPAPPRSLAAIGGEPAAPVSALIGDFLEALLTDGRDISMYVAADSGITAIRPAPYQAIAVRGLGEFEDGSVLTTVDAQTTSGAIDTMQYVVRVEDRGGELAVAELRAGPPRIEAGDGG